MLHCLKERESTDLQQITADLLRPDCERTSATVVFVDDSILATMLRLFVDVVDGDRGAVDVQTTTPPCCCPL
eukprot:scaffold1366_cov91-Cylindrotheca_fusiformis.AAC.10